MKKLVIQKQCLMDWQPPAWTCVLGQAPRRLCGSRPLPALGRATPRPIPHFHSRVTGCQTVAAGSCPHRPQVMCVPSQNAGEECHPRPSSGGLYYLPWSPPTLNPPADPWMAGAASSVFAWSPDATHLERGSPAGHLRGLMLSAAPTAC